MSTTSGPVSAAGSGAGGPTLVAEALAYVCENMAELRQDLSDAAPGGVKQARTLLKHATEALKAGQPVESILNEIHEVFLNAGDQKGLYGRFDPSFTVRDPAGLRVQGLRTRAPDTDETVYLCPLGRCTRSSWPDGERVPQCTFVSRPFEEDRL